MLIRVSKKEKKERTTTRNPNCVAPKPSFTRSKPIQQQKHKFKWNSKIVGTTNNDNDNNNNKKQNCKPKQKTDSGSKRSVEKYLKFPNINRTQRHRIIQPKKFWKKFGSSDSSGSCERESQIELHLNLRILASDKKNNTSFNSCKQKTIHENHVSSSRFQPRFHLLGRAWMSTNMYMPRGKLSNKYLMSLFVVRSEKEGRNKCKNK